MEVVQNSMHWRASVLAVFNFSDSKKHNSKNGLTYLGTMASEIVVGSKWEVDSLLAVWGGKSDTDNSPHISRCQPAFLIIVGAIQLPAFILEHNVIEYLNSFRSGFNSNPSCAFFIHYISMVTHVCCWKGTYVNVTCSLQWYSQKQI